SKKTEQHPKWQKPRTLGHQAPHSSKIKENSRHAAKRLSFQEESPRALNARRPLESQSALHNHSQRTTLPMHQNTAYRKNISPTTRTHLSPS
ncbi:hypothetical protein, partial [Bartonella senegalensis]|uniref:hypothetical protein n=1 Tax=Bartonella senegalensis TaxID=1468418 RepID=UPI001AEC4F94